MAPCISRTHTEVTEPQQRRAATLLAEARELDTAAGDDALDLLAHAPGRPARPRRPGRHPGAAADLPGLDRTAQGNATALSRSCSTRRPAAYPGMWDAIGRTVPSKELAAAGRQTGSAEQPGGSNRQLGRSTVPDNIDRGIGS